MAAVPPSIPPTSTIQDVVLREYLFGNPMNPQDKGIIGQMQDQVRSLIRLGWMLFSAMVAATATLIVDLMVRTGTLHG